MRFKDQKIRVFRSPSKKEPAKVFLGIPDEIKNDPKIPSLKISQIEVLPPPKTFLDLRKTPKIVARKSISGFKSVSKTLLEPGHKLQIKPVGLYPPMMLQPLKIEEVILPEGFIHLDDISDWEIFNYNNAWKLSDRDFKVLPGEKMIPKNYKYQLVQKKAEFTVSYDFPIDDICVYYRRLNDIQNTEWIDWAKIKSNDAPRKFPYIGEFEFRAVPRHKGRPLPLFYDQVCTFDDDDNINWTSLQIDQDTFQVRIEGQLSRTINQVEIIEDNVKIGTFQLAPDILGRIEKEIVINNVSDALEPRLEFRFYRTSPGGKSYCRSEYYSLRRNLASENVIMRVRRETNTLFTIYIEDLSDKMYTPDNPVNPFEGAQWNDAIQRGNLITKLEIIRHQDGETTEYGTYFTNITDEKEPSFLQAPPFSKSVKRVANGFEFSFEDTQEFRDVANLSTPDSDKKVAYEFRLVFWSAGVEESLRTNDEYSFIKEVPVRVRNEAATYKYNYNTWKEEHPRRKYYKIIPVDVQYAYLNHHIEFGRSKNGIILNAGKLRVRPTTHVEVDEKSWKVLYYYNDKQDEIQKFPYYSFDVKVPASSQLSIKDITVEIENGDVDIKLGTYHPSDVISIVDFLGYYEARKFTTKKINFVPAFDKFDDIITKIPNLLTSKKKKKQIESRNRLRNLDRARSFRTIELLTPVQKNENKKTNMFVNKEIAKVVESGELKYNIVIRYHDGKIVTKSLSIAIKDIPQEPSEPAKNLSFSIGNKTVTPETFKVPKSIGKLLVDRVREVKQPKITKINNRFNKRGFRK